MDSQWGSVHRSVEVRAVRMKVSRLVLPQELKAELMAPWHLETVPWQMKKELCHLAVWASSAAS